MTILTRNTPISGMPGMIWPALPTTEASTLLAVLYQLQQAEQLNQVQIESLQFQQLHGLFSHLYLHEPAYHSRLDAVSFNPSKPLTPELFKSLPILSRTELQEMGDNAFCKRIPPEHGHVRSGMTSGSTGRPLTYAKTGLVDFLWNAITLREALLADWDFRGRLAVCRAGAKDGEHSSWGRPENVVFETGPVSIRNIRTDLPDQARWLTDFRPDYLITNPTNLKGLCEWFDTHGGWYGQLKGVRTLGEVVSPELRKICQTVFKAGIRDMYSAAETGYIALQCPEHCHYHVISGLVLVEVLNDDGTACKPGEIGKVVITGLHNLAMPLIRYSIGDYAEVGEACPCGRGSPVLRKIMGRTRNLLTFPDGKKWWPTLPPKKYLHIAPVRQMQLVQKSLDTIEVRLAVDRPLEPAQEEALTIALRDMLKHPFTLIFTYRTELEYGPNHKFDDFISEI
jgi:phenylacetate-CoA ligase